MSLPIKDLVTQGHLTDSIISNMFKVVDTCTKMYMYMTIFNGIQNGYLMCICVQLGITCCC